MWSTTTLYVTTAAVTSTFYLLRPVFIIRQWLLGMSDERGRGGGSVEERHELRTTSVDTAPTAEDKAFSSGEERDEI